MKAKRIFWKGTNLYDSMYAFCPFVGVTIANYDEFVNLIKTKLWMKNKENPEIGHYPPYIFSTKDRNIKILFGGSGGFVSAPINPNTGKAYKWAIFNEFTGKFVKYFSIQESFDEMFAMFEDDEAVQGQIDAMSAIVKRDGGISISVR